MNASAYTIHYVENDLPIEIIGWLSYIFAPGIISMLSKCYLVIGRIMAIPIYFWTLLWHPNGCSIIEMLKNPEGHGQLIQYNRDKNKHCIVGKKDHVSSHDGQSVNIGDKFASVGQILAWILLP
jgi:hypothetical protein